MIYPKEIGQKGQALLIVVLVMVVALTVGLSIASRSVTNLRTSIEEENSQRAFSAAEAGIEQALKSGRSITSPQQLGNNTTIDNISIVGISGNEFLLNGGNFISQDDGFDIWLSNYPAYSNQWPQPCDSSSPPSCTNGSGQITAYWGSSADDCAKAALEIIVISGTKASPVTTRYPFDPCRQRKSVNNFFSPQRGAYTVAGRAFTNKAEITVAQNAGLLVRIIPLYTNAIIGIKSCNINNGNCKSLPPQGTSIESIGASGGTKRKIRVFQGYPQLPSEFFSYILFQSKL